MKTSTLMNVRRRSWCGMALLCLAIGATSVAAQVRPSKAPVIKPPAAPEPAAPASSPLSGRIAVVLDDGSIRPVALHQVELQNVAAPELADTCRATLDGQFSSRPFPPGDYRVRSLAPSVVGSLRYRWNLMWKHPGGPLELTNANAAVDSAQAVSAVTTQASRVSPERSVFERSRAAVVRIESGLGHGTGFVIDSMRGLIVTNDHVIGSASSWSAYLDTLTRVPAQLVARDRSRDLAILRIAPERAKVMPALRLARQATVQPGDRVIAIGFPLSQEVTLTSGIAGSVRETAIMSDLAINPGNSGGPLMTLDGEVVGVNTFREVTREGSPGIAGSVAVSELWKLLGSVESVDSILATLSAPDSGLLPPMSRDAMSSSYLKEFGDTASLDEYRRILDKDANRFRVSFLTPTITAIVQAHDAREVGQERRERESQAGIAAGQGWDASRASYEWEKYVGAPTAPVIVIEVIPKIEETDGSAFGRGLLAVLGARNLGAAKLKFVGDVQNVRFYRNGIEVVPLRGGHGPQVVREENTWVVAKDVADMGYYVLPPEAVSPGTDGAPARLTILVQDLKNPDVVSRTDIEGSWSARLWNDFVPFFAQRGPTPRYANPKMSSPDPALVCFPRAGVCVLQPPPPE